MNNIKNFTDQNIKEEIIKIIKEKIINYLNNNEENLRINDLKRAYNVIQSILPEEYEKLKTLYNSNENGLKKLIGILEISGKKTEFLRALLKKENFPTINDLISVNSDNKRIINNLFEIVKDNKFSINSIFDNDNDLNIFLKLLLSEPYTQGKNVGRGELFLMTLFKNTEHALQGDVKMSDFEIEVKFSKTFSKDGGRILPAKTTLKSPDDISEYFEQLLKNNYNIELTNIIRNKNGKILISCSEKIDNIYNNLKNKLSEKEIFDLLAEMYFYQFNNLLKCKNDFNEFIKRFDKYNFKTLQRLHGCLALMSYHEADNWDWLLVGEYTTGYYYMIDGNDCKLDNFKNNLQILFEDKNYKFSNYPSNTDGAHPMQDKVAQIYISKNKIKCQNKK